MLSVKLAAAAALTLLPAVSTAATCATWPAEVFLLRHAEKLDESADSALGPDGWQRAGGLPKALAGKQVGAIFVSGRRRTQQTAAALAAATGVDPQVIAQDAAGIARIADRICAAGASGHDALVVVGHQATVPRIMEAIEVWPDDLHTPDYGDLVLVTRTGGDAQVTHLRYGDCD